MGDDFFGGGLKNKLHPSGKAIRESPFAMAGWMRCFYGYMISFCVDMRSEFYFTEFDDFESGDG